MMNNTLSRTEVTELILDHAANQGFDLTQYDLDSCNMGQLVDILRHLESNVWWINSSGSIGPVPWACPIPAGCWSRLVMIAGQVHSTFPSAGCQVPIITDRFGRVLVDSQTNGAILHSMMNRYTLIQPTGRILVFSVLECAIIFQRAYGGTLVTDQIGQVSEKHLTNQPTVVYSNPWWTFKP
jgi:hypothetical protein